MPIRMVEDDNNDSYSPNDGGSSNRGGGGAGCLLMLAPLLFSMFRKYPKATIALVVIGAAFYFIGGLSDANSTSDGGGDEIVDNSALKRGCDMKQSVFDSASVFAALSPEKTLCLHV